MAKGKLAATAAAAAAAAAAASSTNEKNKPKATKRNKSTPNSAPVSNLNSNSISIRAKSELDRRLLVAATEGDITYLESVRRGNPNLNSNPRKGSSVLREAVCVSGCTLLHWAAGSNQVGVLEYLLSPLSEPGEGTSTHGSAIFRDNDDGPFRAVDLPVTRCKKSLGRTPLHYACRNGCLEAVRWLVLVGTASIGITAKQGVTPFQLAVWQNRLEICRFLAECTTFPIPSLSGEDAKVQVERFDPAKDFNDFGCGAVHWLGIAPESRANFHRRSINSCDDGDKADDNNNDNDHDSWYSDGRDLLPLAQWLASLPGIDFEARQRQNHTSLHKASWGGHLALVEYLHKEHDMWDDVVDDAGNYAASLADMAHTPKHARIARYLRNHCSRKRAESLAILGLLWKGSTPSATVGAAGPGKDEIRKAYIAKARQLHPDRLIANSAETTGNGQDILGKAILEKIAARSYKDTNYLPTASSFDELRKAYLHLTEEDGVGDQSNPAHSLNLMLRYVNNSGNGNGNGNGNINGSNTADKNTVERSSNTDGEDDSFFKARLVAVLLEYGDKGIDLSNIKKKWKQVWPEIPFPSQQRKAGQQQQAKKIPMSEFLLQKAGDVIRFERHGDRKRRVLVLLKNRNSSKESVLRSDSVVPAVTGVGERQ